MSARVKCRTNFGVKNANLLKQLLLWWCGKFPKKKQLLSSRTSAAAKKLLVSLFKQRSFQFWLTQHLKIFIITSRVSRQFFIAKKNLRNYENRIERQEDEEEGWINWTFNRPNMKAKISGNFVEKGNHVHWPLTKHKKKMIREHFLPAALLSFNIVCIRQPAATLMVETEWSWFRRANFSTLWNWNWCSEK